MSDKESFVLAAILTFLICMLGFTVSLSAYDFMQQETPIHPKGQPELVGQYDITGDGYTKRTLQVYRIKTNRGDQLVTTEWREDN
ncbi:hypothetical protein QP246_02355 [Aerococcus urinae]|uniref:hypothetical protein n=1 Tax=Aerococcus urinae TaxID=1376 RepID=UPI00254E8FCC|nr:hypothetical protein [Aerococcus urinae]MDK6688301.1 hypothetical protein [Aerococcus urinae]